MPNTKYKNALNRKINLFKEDFLNFSRQQYTNKNGKLIHPGEFGTARENACKELLRSVVQNGKNIDTKGFIMNANDETTGEQDLIFYSEIETPLLTLGNDKFFPVETVVAVGQVKSILKSKKDLKEALEKLMKVKAVRDNMGHDSVLWRSEDLWNGRSGYFKEVPYDQVFTFLICEKIEFNINAEEIDLLYEINTPQHLKHNIILDLSKGVYGYRIKPNGPFAGIPFSKDGNSVTSFIPSDEMNMHIIHLLTNLQIFNAGGTIFHPDMGVYLKK